MKFWFSVLKLLYKFIGSVGAKGDTGMVGATGPGGFPGTRGVKGDIGVRGPMGDKGWYRFLHLKYILKGKIFNVIIFTKLLFIFFCLGDKGERGSDGEKGDQGLKGKKLLKL